MNTEQGLTAVLKMRRCLREKDDGTTKTVQRTVLEAFDWAISSVRQLLMARRYKLRIQ